MLETVVIAQGVAIVLLTVVVLGLLRSHGEVLRTLHEVGAGLGDSDVATPPPPPARLKAPARAVAAQPVVGTTLGGEAGAWAFGNGRNTLLAFLSSGCEACQPFWQEFGNRSQPYDDLDVLVVANPEVEDAGLLKRLAPSSFPVVLSQQAWLDFEVPGSPHFVLVDGHTGLVTGEGTAPDWNRLLSFLGRAGSRAGSRGGRRRARSGTEADVDRALAGAGIDEGDPRLYLDPVSDRA